MNSTKNECIPEGGNPLVVAIGGSAGGFKPIMRIVQQLPEWFAGVVIVATHRPPDSKNVLLDIVRAHTRVETSEPQDEHCLECTTIYVGKPDDTVEVHNNAFDLTRDSSKWARLRRIDDLFVSVAESAGPRSVGIILSGLLNDGTAGLKAIRQAGGYCIVQSPEEADFPDMPLNALREVDAQFVGSVEEISSVLMEYSIGRHC